MSTTGKSALSGAASGAASGMAFGPWGAVIGGAIGGGLGLLKGRNADKTQEELDELERQRKGAEIAQSGFANMMNANLMASSVPNAPILAGGGSLSQVLGNTHPNGGTPYGGVELEKGETVYNDDFVFSDRIKPKRSKYTYAQESTKIKNKFKKKLDDPVENAEMQSQLNELAQEQEQQKVRDQAYQIPVGGQQEPEQLALGGYFNNQNQPTHVMPDGTIMPGISHESYLATQQNPEKYQDGGYVNPLDNLARQNNTPLGYSNQLVNPSQQTPVFNEAPNNFGRTGFGQTLLNYGKTGLDAVQNNYNRGVQATPNIFNVGRGLQGLISGAYKETPNLIEYEDYFQENAKVDFDLINPERAIEEAQKNYEKNAYNIAKTSSGSGAFLANMLANTDASAQTSADITNQVNAQNVAITNKEKELNAQATVRDSENMLRALMYNADAKTKATTAQAGNVDNMLNMIERGLQGFGQAANARDASNQQNAANAFMLESLPKDWMKNEKWLELMMRNPALMQGAMSKTGGQ